MTSLSIAFAAALAAIGQTGTPAQTPGSEASLAFVSGNQLLVETAYGLDAIDAQPRVYGQRLSADVSAGQRTVWYSCPDSPQGNGGSSITFDFEAGHRYELVCQSGREAVIRLADGC